MWLGLSGFGGARLAGPRPPGFDERLERANVALAEAPAGHVLLCGDSHADYLEADAPEGLAVVNAAVAGFAARDALAFVSGLRFHRRTRATVLSIGFNDLNGDRYMRRSSVQAFRRTAERILLRLRPWTEWVVVLALPPVAPHTAPPDRPAAIPIYSEAIRRLCAAHPRWTVYADPFAPLRTEHFGVRTPGSLNDEMHVADNAAVWRRLMPLL